jgi:hypothetical protein
MDFPKRIKQHKAQSDSFAILLYRLRNVGIFRNATENDYGIDFEIEMVKDDMVIGRYLKAQVKSSEEVKVRADGIPTIGGIKQTTLLYWAELSYSTHVVVFAIDIATEAIYCTGSIFWQATALLDETDRTKTIQILKPVFDTSGGKKTTGVQKGQLKINIGDYLNSIVYGPSITEIINAHRIALHSLAAIFQLYHETWHRDPLIEVDKVSTMKVLLNVAKILMGPLKNNGELTAEQALNVYSFDYWEKVTGFGTDFIQNIEARRPLKTILPLFLDSIEALNKRILKGEHYWKYKDNEYLKLVSSIKLPIERDHRSLMGIAYDSFNFYGNTEPEYHYNNLS